VAALAAVTFVGPISLPAQESVRGKKLIEFGWDEPDTAFMRKHAAKWTLRVRWLRVPHPLPETRRQRRRLPLGLLGQAGVHDQQVQHAIDDLKATRFKRLRHNFLRFNVTPGDLDWFDDYSAVVNNARLAARVAREGVSASCSTRAVQRQLFDYRKQPGASTKTWEQYAAQARQRAARSCRPSRKGSRTEGADDLWLRQQAVAGDQCGKRPLSECTYGLLAPFLDGMIEAAQGGSQLIDGCESAYSYFEEKKFRTARRMIQKDVLSWWRPREVPEGLLGFVRAVDGLSVEGAGLERRASGAQPIAPDKFEEYVRTALEYADEYVWIYSETPRWWSDSGGPTNLPPAYDAAIRRAASRLRGSPCRTESESRTSTKASDSSQHMFYTFGTDADKASAALFRRLGVTSVECYVTWETCVTNIPAGAIVRVDCE